MHVEFRLHSSKITSKGQITLPQPIRKHLKVIGGSTVNFSIDSDGKVIVSRGQNNLNDVKKVSQHPAINQYIKNSPDGEYVAAMKIGFLIYSGALDDKVLNEERENLILESLVNGLE